MKLLATGSEGKTTADHDHAGMGQNGMEHAGVDHSGMEHAGMDHGGAGGIEWEDDMVEVNRQTTSATMHWRFRCETRLGVAVALSQWSVAVA